MSIYEQSIKDFAEALASKAAVPGGGGASALAGSLAAALGSMVGNLTVGKEKYAAVEPDIRRLMAEAEELRIRLLSCIDEDAEAFAPLSRAYGIPREDPSRAEIMEKCLRDAATPPMDILRLCCRVIELQAELAEKGSSLAVSDAGVGAALARGAMQGAALNVFVNTKYMRDRAYAEALNAEAEALIDKYGRQAEAVYAGVTARLR